MKISSLKGRYVAMTGIALLLMFVGALLLALAWGRPSREPADSDAIPTLESIPPEYWTSLAQKRVFFGHQSVGSNIIQGVQELLEEHPSINLRIIDTTDLEAIEGPGLFHGKIGRNTRPKSKFLAFRRVIENSQNLGVDIGVIKICYIDVRTDSNPTEIFEIYSSTVSKLQVSCPDTVFIHSTVPIEAKNPNTKKILKEAIKSIIGRPGVIDDNTVRQRYNALVLETFQGTSLVFDIARHESIGPDGSMSFHKRGGEKVPLMDGRYSDDGGHLNAVGRRRIAEQFLIQLAYAANPGGP